MEIEKKVQMWIDIADDDLKSSQLLYENGFYRNSYYFFQQASEKAFKAYTLQSQGLSDKELKDVSHDVFKLFKTFIDKSKTKTSSAKEIIKSTEEELNTMRKQNQKEFSKYKNEFDGLTNEEIINATQNDLEEMLQDLKNSLFYNLELPNLYNDKARTKFNEFLNWLGNSEKKAYINLKAVLEELLENDIETIKGLYEALAKLINASSLGQAIAVCALVTAKHNNLTRYPHPEFNPLQMYHPDLPIIKMQPEFMKVLGRALNDLAELRQVTAF